MSRTRKWPLSRVCFFKEGPGCTGPFARITPGSKEVFAFESRRLRVPFYWDRSEEVVSEDVTVWLWETEEELVDDETLPFA